MCELLGLAFNLPVSPNVSFKGFRQRGRLNPDGWGLAFYPDGSAQIFKEPIEAGVSNLWEFVKDCSLVRSRIFIVHVRRISAGARAHKNTHPFSRELNGREYIFAHNGTLRSYKGTLELGRFKPLGDTDSEHAFCYLLDHIEERGIQNWRKSNFSWLHDELAGINSCGEFNCLFSDGTHLFCYYDRQGYNGLCFVHRKAPYGTIRMLDEDLMVDLSEDKDPAQTGILVATRRLTDESWQAFHPGELIVFKDGQIVYSSHRQSHEHQARRDLSPEALSILRLLRASTHGVRLHRIARDLHKTEAAVKPGIHVLLCSAHIQQDSRDTVEWHHGNATFFTVKSKRDEIDELIS